MRGRSSKREQRGGRNCVGRRGRSRGGNYSNNSLEAPKWQQIAWGKQMTSQDATVDSVLSVFAAHGHRFSARNVATAAHRIAKIGRKKSHRLKKNKIKCSF